MTAAETSPILFSQEGPHTDVAHISRARFDNYFDARQTVTNENYLSPLDQITVHNEVAAWVTEEAIIPKQFTAEDYAAVDRTAVTTKIEALTAFVSQRFSDKVTAEDIETTNKFLDATYSMYEDVPADGSVASDADGSFAFVVPARMSRENVEYGQEVEQVIPIMKYVPRNLRSSFMVGLPPFVIDRYNVDEYGKRGYLVFAPMYPDMITDLADDQATMVDIAQAKVDEAVDFAYQRLGTKVIGLGATLPGITNFGKSIANPNVITTTGHGGTVQLILETMRRAQSEGRIAKGIENIGVLGLGSIGASIASVAHDAYPEATTRIFDIKKPALFRTSRATGLPAAENITDLLESSNVILSAVTSKIDLDTLGLAPHALEGKVIVDDSQPACFDPEQVKKYGGTVAWVVGRDGDTIVRGSYSYGEMMADAKQDLFGCEAEAATLSAKYQEVIAQGFDVSDADTFIRSIAIREAVTPQRVAAIAKLFMQYGVVSAPLQAFGKLV